MPSGELLAVVIDGVSVWPYFIAQAFIRMWLEIDTLEFRGFLIPSFLQNEEVLANNHHKRHWDDHACKYSYGWSNSASFCSEDDKNTCICRSCQYNMCVKEEPISAERAFKNCMFNGIKFVEMYFFYTSMILICILFVL